MKKRKTKLNNLYKVFLFMVIVAFIVMMAVSIATVRKTEMEKVDAEGMMRLSSIAGQVDSSLYRAECLLDSVAMQIEQIIAMEGDTEKLLDEYFCDETIQDIKQRSDGSCFSAYTAYRDELYINDFVPDSDFVLDERSWNIGAKTRMGAVYISEPYIDANTGEMCYTLSKLLSDGTTVVGLDFNLNAIQQYIEEMNTDGSGSSLIVNDRGIIVGHSDPEFVGMDYRGLDLYNELINKVYMLYGDTFTYTSGGVRYTVFSDKINYDWYLVVCVENSLQNSFFSGGVSNIATLMITFSVIVIILFIILMKRNAVTEQKLLDREEAVRSVGDELRHSLSEIIDNAENLRSSEENDNRTGMEIAGLAKELKGKIISLERNTGTDFTIENPREKKRKKESGGYHRVKIALVTIVLVATGVFTYIFNSMTQAELSTIKMEKEADLFQNQVREWALTNKAVLDVIADSISAQPHFAEDYDEAVAYLNSIVSNHEDMSVAYLCNPEWEHTVIMNNGWEPDENWHVEERQWYIATMESRDNFNVAAPYLDEQTGLYCTTLSRIVYDSKGNFIGVLGIDYYLDKLIAILDESYTDSGYAFLTDIEGNILNHPNEEYQMKPGYSVNVADLCYRDALLQIDEDSVLFEDYDGQQKGCLAMREEITGFNVFVVRGFYEVLSNALFSNWLYIGVFLLCIIIVNVVMRSITRWQEKVNRELKEAADKAISAGKAKSDFLANMSHEIRTPINAILGMNEMIIRETVEPQIKEYAANIQSAGRTLLSVINEILDFSKIESGKMEIVSVEYDVSSLVNDIVNMVKARATKKNLAFIPEIDENLPSMLYGDDVRLRQIITNLLTNAVKYTHTGSVRLVMKGKKIRDGFLTLEVSVSDTGIGIKEEDMDLLFHSFQRLDQEKNRSIEGTGLGITIVQRLLEMMGSELEVSSVYGEGSTFSFTLVQKIVNEEPMGNYEQRFKAAAESQTDLPVKTAPDARILVVDDNETNLVVAKNLLKRTLAKVDTAPGGKKCISMMKEERYDIVFLDHMMPEPDGIETLRMIKEQGLGQGTVFVALTANAVHGARQTYLDAGFDDYLSKPFTGHDIERCLYSHLRSELIKVPDSSEQTEERQQILPTGLPGPDSMLNVEKGVSYAGDLDAYNQILDVFLSKAPEKIKQIRELFDEKSWKNYVIEVHALKSTSLMIGAESLSELAKELELAGKSEQYGVIEEKNAKLLEMYAEVTEQGRKYLADRTPEGGEDPEQDQITDTAGLTEISQEFLADLAEEIKKACSVFDRDEVVRICTEAERYSYCGKALKPALDEIRLSVEDFEYEQAAEKAGAFMEHMGV